MSARVGLWGRFWVGVAYTVDGSGPERGRGAQTGLYGCGGTLYQLAINSEHPDRTPMAAYNLGNLEQEQGDP